MAEAPGYARGGFRGGFRGGGARGRGRSRSAPRNPDRNQGENQQKKSWKLTYGFRRLTDSSVQEPNEVLIYLVSQPDTLREALDENHDEKMIRLILVCCVRALSCSSLPEKRLVLLKTLRGAEFLQSTLFTYLNQLVSSTEEFDTYKESLLNILNICSHMKDAMPTSVYILRGLVDTLSKICDNMDTAGYIEHLSVKKAIEEWKTSEEQSISKATAVFRKTKTLDADDKRKPPEHFTSIPVFPESADLNMEGRPFLRSNKERGGYQDLDHYLDVQYRLLREDFIAPLREGVQQYRLALSNKEVPTRLRDIKIYTDALIISPQCHNIGLCHAVQFTCRGFSRIKWESSKRLIFGSLLCISTDNFETFSFATVVERNHVKDGIIVINFETSSNSPNVSIPETSFVMAETNAFFEAYRHVLQSLKNFKAGELPFEKYIVACDPAVSSPVYLEKNPAKDNYDLRPLVEGSVVVKDETHEPGSRMVDKEDDDEAPIITDISMITKRANNIQILNEKSWPEPELLHLDTSQYQALKKALTNEFVLIQGPPGTGKTYVGLKITKALLHNHALWNYNPILRKQDRHPILVVCYTNHALDQFMEGIVEFYKGDVVRVGGRISNDTMKAYSLSGRRRVFRQNKTLSKVIFKEKMISREKMDGMRLAINELSERIRNAKLEIIHEDCMFRTLGQQHYESLIFGYEYIINSEWAQGNKMKWDSAIVEWLGYGQMTFTSDKELTISNEQIFDKVEYEDNATGSDFIDVVDEVQVEMEKRQSDASEDGQFEITFNEKLLNQVGSMLSNMGLGRKTIAFRVTDEVDHTSNEQSEEPNENFEGRGWQIQPQERKRLKRYLKSELGKSDRMDESEASEINNVWDIPMKQRWRLYRFWIHEYCDSILNKIQEFQEEFQQACKMYAEVQVQEDKEIMQRSAVIGMTTTCAARYQSVLKDIGPRIIIVEEAAEVLEAHIISTLSNNCEHLILIGDHKQLKPTPTVYELAMKHKLELSLFERMINNKVEFCCLQYQHRMRPEISKIVQIIYPDLQNHEVVNTYEDIQGVSKNVFFIDHKERESSDDESKSHSNEHEAKYMAALCRYLMLQGYPPDKITVLTLYSGQLYALRQKMPKNVFQGVRVTVVDNYQGEENDIILLSLVRSNEDGKIGFLKTENRICVALSRAKKGMFVIGNFEMLATNSELWSKIVELAKKDGFIGEGLDLYCQNHPNESGICAKFAKDFEDAPEGGCMKPCTFRLACGHTCTKICHVIDQEHEDYHCTKPCPKIICERNHLCTGTCSRPCPECRVPVEKTMPKCDHIQDVPCSIDPSKWSCTEKCEIILPCDHKCQRMCGESHTDSCMIKIEKIWRGCGHQLTIPCYRRKEKCLNKCEEKLLCGHVCQGTCGECFQGKMHKSCSKPCNKAHVCGHRCTDICSVCLPCDKRCQNLCSHSNCNELCSEDCVLCLEDCAWECEHYKCTRKCPEACDRPRCNMRCTKVLRCGHQCIGICGEPCPVLCAVCNYHKLLKIARKSADLSRVLFIQLEDCRHLFDVRVIDRLMESPSSVNVQSQPIKLKCCPICSTPIRKSHRYGTVIKAILRDIGAVKKELRVNKTEMTDLAMRLKRQKYDVGAFDANTLAAYIEQRIETSEKTLGQIEMVAIQNQIALLSHLTQIKGKFEKLTNLNLDAMSSIDDIRNYLIKPQKHLTDQVINDVICELDRLSKLHLLIKMQEDKVTDKRTSYGESFTALFDKAVKLLSGGKRYDDKRRVFIKKFIRILKDEHLLSSSVDEGDYWESISLKIAKTAVDGNWLKCTYGHIFYKGTKCPECAKTMRQRRVLVT